MSVNPLPLHNLTMEEALKTLVGWVTSGERRQVSFLNAHCVNVAQVDPLYRKALFDSDLILPDGIGVKLAMQRQGLQLKANVNGTDLFPLLCRKLNQVGGVRLFLLGGKPGVASGVVNWVAHHAPGIEVVGYQHGYFESEQVVLSQIERSGANLVLVAMGVPLQETWIARNLARLDCVVLGVGGLFDFFCGRQKRAPRWVRHLCMEWAYRLWREPRRMWRRYLVGNVVFLARLMLSPRSGVGDPLLLVAESPSLRR